MLWGTPNIFLAGSNQEWSAANCVSTLNPRFGTHASLEVLVVAADRRQCALCHGTILRPQRDGVEADQADRPAGAAREPHTTVV